MDFNENKPIYLQLADLIMDEAAQSNADGTTRLLSVREYASRAGVNANTVMRTYTFLQQEGIIYNQRGIGYFYTPEARQKVFEMRRRTFFEHEIEYFMDRMATLRISPEEFDRLYRAFLDRSKSKEAITN